jgi:2-methylisocitrate lyase-like PEP mutase family enzyme
MRCASASLTPPAQALRSLFQAPGLHLGPCAHDGLSAKLIERNGSFRFMFMSGFCVSAAQIGEPDAGLISYGEMLDTGRRICAATRLPVIGDGDTGYGNAMNAKRTVRGYAQAGFAGVLIEDQQHPKQCGHMRTRAVVSRGEAVARIRAACDARDEGADICILARSDARSVISLDEALWRVKAFADAGADAVFVDALTSREDMEALCRAVPQLPKMANMLEGGSTPMCSPAELQDMGFKICAYPLSLLGVSMLAMEKALGSLSTGTIPADVPSFAHIQNRVGFDSYYAEESRYKA